MTLSTETISLCLTILTAAVGATWALRSGLSKIEGALGNHIVDDSAKFGQLDGRVIKLERRRR